MVLTFIAYFLGMLIFVQFNSIYALYLFSKFHVSNHELSFLFMLNCLMVGLLQVALIYSLKNKSQLVVMLVGILLIGCGFFVLLFGHTYEFAILSVVVITFGEMLFMPVSQNSIYQRAHEALKGYYAGIYQALYSITLIISPLWGSFLLKADLSGKFLWTFSLFICAIPLIAYFFLRKRGFILSNDL